MADVKEKACPFRVRRVLRQTTLGGPGSEYVDEFLPCDGEDCAAYCQGACLRLLPPALVIDNDFSDDDLKEIRERMMDGGIHIELDRTPEIWQNCSNCANSGTKTVCHNCIQSMDRDGQATSIPSNWEYDGGVDECPF